MDGDDCTLHLAEDHAPPERQGAPLLCDSKRVWVEYESPLTADPACFPAVGAALLASGIARQALVGSAPTMLVNAYIAVDIAAALWRTPGGAPTFG